MRVQSVNNNQKQYNQNFGASVKAIHLGDALKGVFGHGPVSTAKPLIKNLAGDDVILGVANAENVFMGPSTEVIAATIRDGKMYKAKVSEYVPFKENVVKIAQDALAQLELKISIAMDVKTEERLARIDKLKIW